MGNSGELFSLLARVDGTSLLAGNAVILLLVDFRIDIDNQLDMVEIHVVVEEIKLQPTVRSREFKLGIGLHIKCPFFPVPLHGTLRSAEFKKLRASVRKQSVGNKLCRKIVVPAGRSIGCPVESEIPVVIVLYENGGGIFFRIAGV